MKLSIFFIPFAFFIACNMGEPKPEKNMEAPEAVAPGYSSGLKEEKPQKAQDDSDTESDDRKMIWKAKVSFQVASVDSSTKEIQNLVSKHKGFISSMNLSSTNRRISNNLVIRLPNDEFETLINDLKKGALFLDELSITSNDVTEEFVDIESRLKTKKEVRNRYIEILRNKTGSVKDVIEAENAIREITEEIEAKEGRLRYLRNQVSMSTISLNIYQKVKFKAEPEIYEKSYGQKILDSLKNGWTIITSLILLLANIWPIVIIVLLILWRRKWIVRKISKRSDS